MQTSCKREKKLTGVVLRSAALDAHICGFCVPRKFNHNNTACCLLSALNCQRTPRSVFIEHYILLLYVVVASPIYLQIPPHLLCKSSPLLPQDTLSSPVDYSCQERAFFLVERSFCGIFRNRSRGCGRAGEKSILRFLTWWYRSLVL